MSPRILLVLISLYPFAAHAAKFQIVGDDQQDQGKGQFQVANKVSPADVGMQLAYKVGGRAERIRFFMSEAASGCRVKDSIMAGEQMCSVNADRVGADSSSPFARLANAASGLGLEDFAGKSEYYGLIVNPTLLTCETDLLKIVKAVGDKNADIFDKYRLDEINLFLYPAVLGEDATYKLELAPVASAPKDPALNVQIPFIVKIGACALPSEAELEAALKRAASGKNDPATTTTKTGG